MNELLFLTGFALGIAVVASPFAYYYALETRAGARSRRDKGIAEHEGER